MIGQAGFNTPADAQRAAAAVRAIEARNRGAAGGEAPAGPANARPYLAEVTGPAVAGLYPAKLVTWDDAAGAWVTLPGEVRYKHPDGAAVPVGYKSLARFSGPTADGANGVYVGHGGCAYHFRYRCDPVTNILYEELHTGCPDPTAPPDATFPPWGDGYPSAFLPDDV